MRNLLNFLARYNSLIIFLLLEGLAVYLVATRNNYHNTVIVKGVRSVTVALEKRISDAAGYMRLRNINRELAAENTSLRNRLEKLERKDSVAFSAVVDSAMKQQYEFTSARIVNNTVNRQKNFFTVNKGRAQGIGADMAVIGPDGVAGLIVASSENFSVGMSLLNLDFRLSTKIKSNGYFGSLTWDGRDYRYAVLNEIPQHVELTEGDTVETTSFSAIFPEGFPVGVISSFEKSGSDFYYIKIKLASDFRRLNYLTIIKNLKREEQVNIEMKNQ